MNRIGRLDQERKWLIEINSQNLSTVSWAPAGAIHIHSISFINDVYNRISGVMVCMLTSSAVDHVFEAQSDQTEDYKISICCFSAKHAALRRMSKDWLDRNQDNVSEWSDMSTFGLLFQWASTIKIQLGMLV
jgi:hypothetical protein